MVNMGSNVHHNIGGQLWRVPRLGFERDIIRQQKRISWIKGFIFGVGTGGAIFYGLIQFWGG